MGVEQSRGATRAPGHIAIGGLLGLSSLSRCCIPSEDGRILRPEAPKYAKLMGTRPSEEWEHALRTIWTAMDRDNRGIGVDLEFYRWLEQREHTYVLKAIAIILFDRECTSDSVPTCLLNTPPPPDPLGPVYMWPGPDSPALDVLPRVFEHMLRIDYGLHEEERPLQPASSPEEEDENAHPEAMRYFYAHCLVILDLAVLCRRSRYPRFPTQDACEMVLRTVEGFRWHGVPWCSDMALMCHWFCTRRRRLTEVEARQGLTGYMGVLQEMVDDVPHKGKARLIRKLSVDVNLMIPTFIVDPAEQAVMVREATRLALEHKIPLTVEEAQEKRRKADAEKEREAAGPAHDGGSLPGKGTEPEHISSPNSPLPDSKKGETKRKAKAMEDDNERARLIR